MIPRLNQDQIAQIHNASLRILDRTGVRFYESLHDLARASRAPYLRYLSGLEEQLPPA